MKEDLPEDLYCMSFDNSGNQLAASSGHYVYLFSTDQDLRLRGRLSGPVNFVNSVDFSKNDNLLVASSSDKACYIWNLNSKQLVDSLTGHGDKVTTAKFCMNCAASMVSASRDRSIILWDIQSKMSINKLFLNSSCIDFISFSSLTGISAHADKNIRMIDFRSSKIELEQSLPDKITSICASIDRNILAVSCRDDCIYLCDPRFSKEPIQINNKNLKFPCDWSRIGLAPDGAYVSAGSKQSDILVWNITKKCPETLLTGGHKYPVVSCAWNSTGKGLATCDTHDQRVHAEMVECHIEAQDLQVEVD
ncbi:hypothetical protein MXB_3164 [Myxobolus squamalis]|nr:hypothetical protein MXB_3164 [Myxobolus squamalis]